MWLLNELLSAVVSALIGILQFLVGLFGAAFKLDGDNTLDNFFTVFPVARVIGNGMMGVGYILITIIAVYQLFKAFFGPLAESEHPTHIMGNFIVAVALVSFSRWICNLFYEAGAAVYSGLEQINLASVTFQNTNNAANNTTYTMDEVAGSLLDELVSDGWGALTVGTGAALGTVGLQFLLIIGFTLLIQEFFKLMCEAVERYIVLGILSIFAPLCLATVVSKSTNRIAGNWVQMMISQVILICLNVVFLYGFLSGLASLVMTATGNTQVTGSLSGALTNMPVVFVMLYAWLKVGQRVDDYLNQLGLTAARSGGFGNELLGSVSRAAGVANSSINQRYGTQFGTAQGPRNPLSGKLNDAISGGRNRKIDAMRTDGSRFTAPSKRLDAAAKKKDVSSKDLATAMNRNINLGGAQAGNALAKSMGLNTAVLGEATEACTISKPNRMGQYSAHLEFGDGNSMDLTTDASQAAQGAATFTDENGNQWYLTAANGEKTMAALGLGGDIQDMPQAGVENANGVQLEGDKNIVGAIDTSNMEEVQANDNGDMFQEGVFDEDGKAVEGADHFNEDGYAVDADGNLVQSDLNVDDAESFTPASINEENQQAYAEGYFDSETGERIADDLGIANVNENGIAVNAEGEAVCAATLSTEGMQQAMVDPSTGALYSQVAVDKNGQIVSPDDPNYNDSLERKYARLQSNGEIMQTSSGGTVFAPEGFEPSSLQEAHIDKDNRKAYTSAEGGGLQQISETGQMEGPVYNKPIQAQHGYSFVDSQGNISSGMAMSAEQAKSVQLAQGYVSKSDGSMYVSQESGGVKQVGDTSGRVYNAPLKEGVNAHTGYSRLDADGVASRNEDKGAGDLHTAYYDRAHDSLYSKKGNGYYGEHGDTTGANYATIDSATYNGFVGDDGKVHNYASGHAIRYARSSDGTYTPSASGDYMMTTGGGFQRARVDEHGGVTLKDTSQVRVAGDIHVPETKANKGVSYTLPASGERGTHIQDVNGQMYSMVNPSQSVKAGSKVQVYDTRSDGTRTVKTVTAGSERSYVAHDTVGGFRADSNGQPIISASQQPSAERFVDGEAYTRDATGTSHWVDSRALTKEGYNARLSEGYIVCGSYLVKHSDSVMHGSSFGGRQTFRNVSQQRAVMKSLGATGKDAPRVSRATQTVIHDDSVSVLPNVQNPSVLAKAKPQKTAAGTVYTFKGVTRYTEQPVKGAVPVRSQSGQILWMSKCTALYNATSKKWDFKGSIPPSANSRKKSAIPESHKITHQKSGIGRKKVNFDPEDDWD